MTTKSDLQTIMSDILLPVCYLSFVSQSVGVSEQDFVNCRSGTEGEIVSLFVVCSMSVCLSVLWPV